MEANVAYADSIYENLSERIKAAEDKAALGHIVGECSKKENKLGTIIGWFPVLFLLRLCVSVARAT